MVEVEIAREAEEKGCARVKEGPQDRKNAGHQASRIRQQYYYYRDSSTQALSPERNEGQGAGHFVSNIYGPQTPKRAILTVC